MRLRAWLRSGSGKTAAAVFLWCVTSANVLWLIGDLRERYEEVMAIQALRAGCEARGGFYGRTQTEAERCFMP